MDFLFYALGVVCSNFVSGLPVTRHARSGHLLCPFGTSAPFVVAVVADHRAARLGWG
jgi:hypothetical protein